MSESVIKVQGLSKLYKLGELHKQTNSFRDRLTHSFRNTLSSIHSALRGKPSALSSTLSSHDDTIWALKDVSFQVKRGEVLGIIGRNGAGKSTLLKILSRITKPTKGKAWIKGRVGSLLEVGTGFHPELTGRENIYLNGAILGMRRAEINSKFDEIVAFAEIEKFIDTPVKRYSSGMYVRLAFAVAANLEPEILLIDEVLAVGDVAFQKKCLGKMGDISKEGRTVLFVSHNMGAINQLCKRCLMLDRGHLIKDDASDIIVSSYILNCVHSGLNSYEKWERSGTGKVSIHSISLLDDTDNTRNTFLMGQDLKLRVSGGANDSNIEFTLGIQFVTHTDIPVMYLYNQFNLFQTTEENDFMIEIIVPELSLMPGSYFLHIWIGRHGLEEFDYIKYIASFDVIQSKMARVTHPINQQLGLVYGDLSARQVR